MKTEFERKVRIKVLDFTGSIYRLSNALMILNTYYDLCFQDYDDFWRINCLIEAVMSEHDAIMEELEEVRALFLD